MKKIVCLFICLFIGSANATVILLEDFNTNGLGTRYTAEGAGGANLGCCQNWSLNSEDEGNLSDILTGFEGLDFWSGSDLNDHSLVSGFSISTPRNLLLNSVSIGAFTNELLTVSLASSTTLDFGGDFLRVLAINSDTSDRIVLDMFDGSTAGLISGVTLGTTFQDISYDLSGLGFSNLTIGFEAWTTSNNEVVGIDNIRLTGNNVSAVPEPASLVLFGLGFGLVGFVALRKKKNA